MYDNNAHRGRDRTRGNARGRSYSVSVRCNGVFVLYMFIGCWWER